MLAILLILLLLLRSHDTIIHRVTSIANSIYNTATSLIFPLNALHVCCRIALGQPVDLFDIVGVLHVFIFLSPI